MLTETPSVRQESPVRSGRHWMPSFKSWRNLIVGLVLISPLLGRAWFLLSVPNIEPFDVDQFCRVEIPPGQNAFDDYREACRLNDAVEVVHKANNTPMPLENYDDVMTNGWRVASEPLKAWLEDYREALNVWRRGSGRSDALYLSPREFDFTTDFTTQLPVIPSVRHFARLAKCEAMRLEAAGDFAEARNWYIAILRCSRHLTLHAFGFQRMTGSALHAMSSAGLVRWAEDSHVTADQLRLALNEVQIADRMTAPLSTTLKAEYVLASNTFKRRDWPQMIGLGTGGTANPPIVTFASVLLWVFNEPQTTDRLLRQILANQLNEVDRPLPERQSRIGMGNAMLFQPDPNVTRNRDQLVPAEINRAIARLPATQIFIPRIEYVEQLEITAVRDRAKQVTLEAALAAQAYRRDHGEFPEDPTALVPEYLDVWPADPSDKTGQSIRYRRNNPMSAIVWSVGPDGNDDGGDVIHSLQPAPDVGILLQTD